MYVRPESVSRLQLRVNASSWAKKEEEDLHCSPLWALCAARHTVAYAFITDSEHAHTSKIAWWIFDSTENSLGKDCKVLAMADHFNSSLSKHPSRAGFKRTDLIKTGLETCESGFQRRHFAPWTTLRTGSQSKGKTAFWNERPFFFHVPSSQMRPCG